MPTTKLGFALFGACLVLLARSPGLTAAEPEKAISITELKRDTPVDFEKEVLPILRKNCIACHNTTKKESELSLETPQTMLQGGSLGAGLVAGKGTESLILQVAARQGEPFMPPAGNSAGAKPLTPDELGLLKLWIDQGAKGEVKGGTASIQWQPLPPGVNPIYAVAISPDGQYAAAARANQIFVYHVPSKREIGRLTDPSLLTSGVYNQPGVADLDLIQSLRFSPNSEFLASGGYRTAKIWRRPRHVHLADLAGLDANAISMAVSPDGKLAAIGQENGKIQLFDLPAGKLARTITGHSAPVTGLEFSGDNVRLVSSSRDKSIRLWNVADGAALAKIGAPVEANAVRLVNKETILAVGGQDNLVRLYSATGPALPGLPALTAPVATVAASADKKWLATGTADGKITLIDVTTGQAAKTLDGHPGGVTGLAFNAPATRLASIGADKTIRLWDAASGQAVWSSVAVVAPWTAVAIHPSGNQLIAGAADGSLRSWKLDVPEAKPLAGDNGIPPQVAAVSPDRRWLATAAVVDGKPAITLRDLAAGTVVRNLAGHEGTILSLGFSLDGTRLISGSEDKTARVWNVADGAQVVSLGHPAAVSRVAINGNGQQAATVAADNSFAAWNVADGKQQHAFAGHAGPIVGICFSADNQTVLSASADKTLRWWNSSNGQAVRSVDLGAEASALGISKDGARVAVTAGPAIKVVQVADGQIPLTLAGMGQPARQLSFAADGSRVLAADGKIVTIWESTKGVALESLTQETLFALFAGDANTMVVGAADKSLKVQSLRIERLVGDHAQTITGLSYSPDGGAVFSASLDGTVRRWVPSTGQQQFAANHGAAVHGLALSPNAQWLASAGEDKQVKVWNAGNGAAGPKPVLSGFSGPARAVAFAPDNVKLAASDAGSNQIFVFDVNEGLAEEIQADHAGPVTALAATGRADAANVFASAAGEPSLRLWAPRAGRKLAGHGQPITSLGVIGDNQIVSGSLDGTVRQWDINNGQMVRQYNHGAPVEGVAVRPDGQRIASASSNNTAKLWNATNGQQVAELKGDFREGIRVNDLTRAVALTKRKVEGANADLKAANERKAAEEKNATMVAEAKTKADEDLTKKTEAAKQPVADKEAADKAFEEAKAAFAKAEEVQKAAVAAVPVATEAVAKAKTELEGAVKAANETAAAAKAAAENLTKAQDAAKADPNNATLAEAVKAADQAAKDADAKSKTAAEAKTAAEKKVADAEAAKKAADEAKTKSDQDATNAKNAVAQAEAKAKQVAPAAQKAIDEKTAAERAQQAAVRAVERAAASVKKATEEIPMYEQAVAAETERSKQAEGVLEEAKKQMTATEKPIRQIAFSADGRTLATSGDDQLVHTWDGEAGVALEVFAGQSGPVTALAFTPAGQVISAGPATAPAIVWNTSPEWKLERVIGDINDAGQLVDRVTALDFSPDNKILATGSGEPSRSGQIKLWNVENGSLVREVTEPHSDTVLGLEFSPDGTQIASSAADRFAKIFNVADGKFVRSFEGHTHHVLGVSWRADGRLLATAGADNVIKVWNVRTGDQERTIQGFGKEVTGLRFLADGDTVVASAGDNFVRIKNAANGGNVRDLGGSTDFVYSVGATADGKLIGAGGQDSVFRIWNDAGQVVVSFEAPKTATN